MTDAKPLDPTVLVAQLQEARILIDALTDRCGVLRRQVNALSAALVEAKSSGDDKAPGSLTGGQSTGGDEGTTQLADAASVSSASPQAPQRPGPEPR